MDRPPMQKPPDPAVTFLESRAGAMIAVFAWARYQERGRGAVTVREQDLTRQPGKPRNVRLGFMAESDTEPEEWPGERERELVRTYDPEREWLVFVLREDGCVSAYRFRAPQPLAEVAAARRRQAN